MTDKTRLFLLKCTWNSTKKQVKSIRVGSRPARPVSDGSLNYAPRFQNSFQRSAKLELPLHSQSWNILSKNKGNEKLKNMRRIAKLSLLLLVTNLWGVTAKLRNKKKGERSQGKDQGLDEDGYEEVETVEVIIGMNIQDDEPTFSTMSNTIDIMSNSVSLESILPQIKSGVARIPLDVGGTGRSIE